MAATRHQFVTNLTADGAAGSLSWAGGNLFIKHASGSTLGGGTLALRHDGDPILSRTDTDAFVVYVPDGVLSVELSGATSPDVTMVAIPMVSQR